MRIAMLVAPLLFNMPLSWGATPKLEDLRLPDGFKIKIYAEVPGARSLALGPNGIVFVGARSGKSVYAVLPDKNKDGTADRVIAIGSDLEAPNGVAFKEGDLYVGEVDRVLRFRDIEKKLTSPGKPEEFGPKFPSETHHGWKYLAFGPDGWLYIPVGAPCNVCDKDLKTYAALHRISPDGSKRELVATGIRNTVGFDWDPQSKDLWFTDNGRDMMGDDKPVDELNRLSKVGQSFGFPFCHGVGEPDPEFGKGKNCADFTSPVHGFPAHSAALGMKFIQKNPQLKNSILVAEHGSWNRSSPIGYQVTRLEMKANKVVKAEAFLSGFLKDGKVSGRPVDVLELGDGSILVSDDLNGVLYRIWKG